MGKIYWVLFSQMKGLSKFVWVLLDLLSKMLRRNQFFQKHSKTTNKHKIKTKSIFVFCDQQDHPSFSKSSNQDKNSTLIQRWNQNLLLFKRPDQNEILVTKLNRNRILSFLVKSNQSQVRNKIEHVYGPNCVIKWSILGCIF